MKIVEITQGIQLQITNEEADLLGRFYDESTVHKKEFNEREAYVANQLVNKNVLLRKNQDGQIVYSKR
jgi:hypothetical protein